MDLQIQININPDKPWACEDAVIDAVFKIVRHQNPDLIKDEDVKRASVGFVAAIASGLIVEINKHKMAEVH